jgi:thioesterase domain-containing protein
MQTRLLQELQETFLREIPIARHIGLRVDGYKNEQLILFAPLAANINHKQTAFAGSLTGLATLAGWGRLWLLLREYGIPGKIVIQDSTSSYRRPVESDFVAICQPLNSEKITKIVAALERHSKARVELNVEIHSDDIAAMSFKGRYVMFRDLRLPRGTLA